MSTNEQAARAEAEDVREVDAAAYLREGHRRGERALLARLSDPDDALVEAVARPLLTDYQGQYDGGSVDEFADLARAALAAVAARLAGGE